LKPQMTDKDTQRVGDFIRACCLGNLAVAERLLAQGASSNARDRLSQVPLLSMVVGRRQLQVVHLLLSHGADVNAHSPQSRTALMTAGIVGFCEVCPVLVAAGARYDERHGSHTGSTARSGKCQWH
jgi:ankyrin repeat protein